jgi:hypothetical protein
MTGLLYDAPPASSKGSALPDDDHVLASVERGSQVLRQELLDEVRATHAMRIEMELLEAIPEVCALVQNELDEVAARREKTRATYRRRFAKFQAWADTAGWRFPYPPAAVALYFIERTNDGAPISEIHADRIAIAACHEEQGFAAPCRRDPLVRAIVKYLDTSPPDDGDGVPVPKAA